MAGSDQQVSTVPYFTRSRMCFQQPTYVAVSFGILHLLSQFNFRLTCNISLNSRVFFMYVAMYILDEFSNFVYEQATDFHPAQEFAATNRGNPAQQVAQLQVRPLLTGPWMSSGNLADLQKKLSTFAQCEAMQNRPHSYRLYSRVFVAGKGMLHIIIIFTLYHLNFVSRIQLASNVHMQRELHVKLVSCVQCWLQ